MSGFGPNQYVKFIRSNKAFSVMLDESACAIVLILNERKTPGTGKFK